MSKIIISVYFNGTDESNQIFKSGIGMVSLPAILSELTVQNKSHISLCYNGCGINNPYYRDLGIIFTYHLESQVSDAAKRIEAAVRESRDEVTVNVYGFSRGGVGAFLLCQKLKHIPSDRLRLNVVAFEPVPGNFVITTHCDFFLGTNNSVSASVSDLTTCNNISNMLILFTNEPLPDIAAHAPILPTCPKSCNTEIDVTPGCHKGAVAFMSSLGSIKPMNKESVLVFHRVMEFMERSGTLFDLSRIKFGGQMEFLEDLKDNPAEKMRIIRRLYEDLVGKQKFHGSNQRAMHLSNTIFTKPDGKTYLNRYHQNLCGEANVSDEKNILSLKQYHSERATDKYHSQSKILQLLLVLAIGFYIYNKFTKEAVQDHSPLRLGI